MALGQSSTWIHDEDPTPKNEVRCEHILGGEFECGLWQCVNLLDEIIKIWPKALPHYVLISLCRHRFVHLRSSCYIMPLFLLLISPSALTLSDLYFRNTSPGQKQYSNTSPRRLVVVGFLVPLTQFIFVFSNTSPAHKLLYRTSLCSNVAGQARPLSVIHGIMSTILLICSNSLDDADKWHRSHSMH